MKTLVEKILGANWRTNLFGWLTLLLAAIAVRPALVDFVPEPWRGYLVGAAGIFAFVSGGAFVSNAKDKQITGNGSLAEPYRVQDPEARTPSGNRRISPVVIAFLAFSPLVLTGCEVVSPRISARIPHTDYQAYAYAGGGIAPVDPDADTIAAP